MLVGMSASRSRPRASRSISLDRTATFLRTTGNGRRAAVARRTAWGAVTATRATRAIDMVAAALCGALSGERPKPWKRTLAKPR